MIKQIIPQATYVQRFLEWESIHNGKTDMRLGQYLMGIKAMHGTTDPEVFYMINTSKAADLFAERYVIGKIEFPIDSPLTIS